jgi:hypothetical protein
MRVGSLEGRAQTTPSCKRSFLILFGVSGGRKRIEKRAKKRI